MRTSLFTACAFILCLLGDALPSAAQGATPVGPAASSAPAPSLEPAASPPEDEARRFELGAHHSSVRFDDFYRSPAVGGRVTYNLTRHLALEAEQNFLPREFALGVGASGRALQGQFGVKAGKRFGRFGLFAKARPGFVSFGRSYTLVATEMISFNGVPRTFGTFEFRRRTFFSGDVGGVFEIYPSRRFVVRFDAGDTVIAYGARHIEGLSLSELIKTAPAETRHNFQVSSGIAFRF